MKNNSIAVGDVVRVSELPKIYERIGSRIVQDYKCRVVKIDDGMALLDSIPAKHTFLFPTKYLYKVNAEPKNEPKFKIGDKVISKFPFQTKVYTVLGHEKNCPWLVMIGDGEFINEDFLATYTSPSEPKKDTRRERERQVFKIGDIVRLDKLNGTCEHNGVVGTVCRITSLSANDDNDPSEWYYGIRMNDRTIHSSLLLTGKTDVIDGINVCDLVPVECVRPKSEPEKPSEEIKSVLTDDFKAKIKAQIEVFADGAYWSAYIAQLAHDIAVAYAEKNRYEPTEVGANAVKVAKAVAEGLKRK